MALSERVAELLAAIDALEPDEREAFDAALNPEPTEPDYDTPIVLAKPLTMTGRDDLTEIRCTTEPTMAHFVMMTKLLQRGDDEGTMLLKIGFQLTGVRVEDLKRLGARDSGVFLGRMMEWLGPFMPSVSGLATKG